MEYQTFKEELLDILREKTEGKKKVSIQKVEKNNGIVQEAVSLRCEKDIAVPTIYLEEFYEMCKKGGDVRAIANRILEVEEERRKEVDFSLDSFENYEKARSKVYYKLINYKMNEALLKKIPHKKYLDLAVVYYYKMEGGKLHGATILIHNCNLSAWGIDEEQIMGDAVMNTCRKLPYSFNGMEALISELTGEETMKYTAEELMYVLTNEEKYFGAAALLYPHVLEHIAKVLKKNFYVLPSSVHECILVPDRGLYSRDELKQMVREVNNRQVETEEVLSYEVYYYDREKKTLIL